MLWLAKERSSVVTHKPGPEHANEEPSGSAGGLSGPGQQDRPVIQLGTQQTSGQLLFILEK